MKRVRIVLEDSPHKVTNVEGILEALASLSDCAASCNACADACLGEQSIDRLRKCIRLNFDCSSACIETAGLLCRPGMSNQTFLEAQLQACLAICQACGDECQMHAKYHDHCKACAEACYSCMNVCQRLLPEAASLVASAA